MDAQPHLEGIQEKKNLKRKLSLKEKWGQKEDRGSAIYKIGLGCFLLSYFHPHHS